MQMAQKRQPDKIKMNGNKSNYSKALDDINRGGWVKITSPNVHTRSKMIKGKPWMNNSTLCKY